jgi:hypothetical protein
MKNLRNLDFVADGEIRIVARLTMPSAAESSASALSGLSAFR